MRDSTILPTRCLSEQGALTGHAILRLAGLATANAALLLAITPFALLREDPLFWRNAGGWPVWLRETVYLTFYPLLAAELMVLLALSTWFLIHPRPAIKRRRLWPLAAVMWFWTGAVLLIVASNNIANLIAGRPLHWHPN